jgi:hypothetical protein
MSIRKSFWGKARPARNADNLTVICEPIVYTTWDPQHLTILQASTDYYRDSFTYFIIIIIIINSSSSSSSSRRSSVGIACRMDDRGVGVRVSLHLNFSLLHVVQAGSGVQPASCPMGTGALSPGVKRQGREADHSPPSNADVTKTCIYTSIPPYAFMEQWLYLYYYCYYYYYYWFDTRWGEFLNLPNPSGRTRPWGLLSLQQKWVPET